MHRSILALIFVASLFLTHAGAEPVTTQKPAEAAPVAPPHPEAVPVAAAEPQAATDTQPVDEAAAPVTDTTPPTAENAPADTK